MTARPGWLPRAAVAGLVAALGAGWVLALSRIDGAAAAVPAKAVAPAAWPALTLQDLAGAPQRLDGASPQVRVVNLWARWCAPCRRELPALQRLAPMLASHQVQLLTVALDDDDFGLREYLASRGLTLPVWRPASADLAAQLALHSLPQTLVLDRQGRVVQRIVGERDWDAEPERARLLAIVERLGRDPEH